MEALTPDSTIRDAFSTEVGSKINRWAQYCPISSNVSCEQAPVIGSGANRTTIFGCLTMSTFASLMTNGAAFKSS
jgi:hypothetical protein